MSNTTKNYYQYVKKAPQYQNPNFGRTHMFELPFRALIVSASGAGKSNTFLNMLENLGPAFMKVHLSIANPEEPLYELLKDKLKDKLEIYTGEIPCGKRAKGVQPNTPKIDEIAEKDNEGYIPQLLCYDDITLYEHQPRVEEAYIRGRKLGCSMVYISQSFYKIPITVRRNCNYFILKRNITASDLKKLFNMCSLDMSLTDFLKHYRNCTSTMEDFLMIDIPKGRLYHGFDTTPLFENYKENKEPEFKYDQVKLPNPDVKKYDYRSGIILGVRAFVQALIDQYEGLALPFSDLKTAYVNFVRENNFEEGKEILLAKHLGSVFNKTLHGGHRYYIIER